MTDEQRDASARLAEPMMIEQIMSLIPHRPPFLLVDRVTHLLPGKFIQGFKQISMNEPYFVGHFPGRPILPGVLQVEALAQLGAVLIAQMPEGEGKLAVFAGINEVRFRRLVVPGDRLDLFAELTRIRHGIGKSIVRASVNGEPTVEGELMFSLIPSQ